MKLKRPRWDRYAIKAAIHRRGKSLSELAIEAGLDESACRAALIRRLPSGEKAIADFLGIPARTLWPARYRSDSQAQPIPAASNPASRIGQAA